MNALTDKMDLRGVSSLTDGELLALLLGDEAMAATLLDSYDGSLLIERPSSSFTEADLWTKASL